MQHAARRWRLAGLAILVACSSPADVTTPAVAAQSDSRVITGARSFSQVVAGFLHTCAIADDATAHCWGSNDYSQLGAVSASRSPQPVVGDLRFTTLAAGWVQTCGITTAGPAYCWGGGAIGKQGYLGDATLSRSHVPVRVIADSSFTSLTIGDGHTCALTASGMAWCWGANRYGQVGDGSREDRAVPVAVATDLRFRSLSAGAQHTCGITTGNDAYCWGINRWGELGSGDVAYNAPGAESVLPARVLGSHEFRSVAAGWEHTCAVTSQAQAYCWGRNDNARQLGDASAITHRGTPVAVAGGHAFASLTAGPLSTCGLTPDSEAFCWGSNYYGALGNGETSRAVGQAVRVQGGPFRAVGIGQAHACGIAMDGRVWCWGDQSAGQY